MTNENNTPDTPQRKSLPDMTILEVINECGRLKYPLSKILSILQAKDQDLDMEDIKSRLTTPGTEEYQAYRSGIDAGDFEVDAALYSDVISGTKTSVDSQKALHDIQRERNINDAIRDKFFPEDGDS
ncbi:hypothetical protein IR083_10120 [Dysgonomonas sp. GY75]|uniref:hypothetical protein n=1 Tax=Dysgonomonas sp. GY75 TaxID=2780419 RepID=UPI00188419E3|nr:hypothetical protein [Dysgonomonas sp. GY75]MBF0649176.1 hypothetical protein [Dysgonomonas sp. GY75]